MVPTSAGAALIICVCAAPMLVCASRPSHSTETSAERSALQPGSLAETSQSSLGSQEVHSQKAKGICLNFKSLLETIIKLLLGRKTSKDYSNVRVPANPDVFTCAQTDACIDVFLAPESDVKIGRVLAKVADQKGNFAQQVEGTTILEAREIGFSLKVKFNQVTWVQLQKLGNGLATTSATLSVNVKIAKLEVTIAAGSSTVDTQGKWDLIVGPNVEHIEGAGATALDQIAKFVLNIIPKGPLGNLLVNLLKGEIAKAIQDNLNQQTSNPAVRVAAFATALIPRTVATIDKAQAGVTKHRAFAEADDC